MKEHADGPEITAYLDGALDAAARPRVEAHLAACADCSAEADSLRHLKAALIRAPRKRLPADLALALERRRGAAVPAARPRAWLWASSGALAAAVLFGLARWSWSPAQVEEIPLEPLLTAHARYSAESPLTGTELAASSYSAPFGDLVAEAEEQE